MPRRQSAPASPNTVPRSPDPGGRYARQLLLPGWTPAIQSRLATAHVVVIGAGGLGSTVAIQLAGAGVGRLTVIDHDIVELSNLNRQTLHPEKRIGQPKAESAAATLRAFNSQLEAQGLVARLTASSARRLIGRPDLVADCLDNHSTRLALNHYCWQHRIPWVHGAIWGLCGELSTFVPPNGPCYACLVPESPPRQTVPVLGATPATIGALQATAALGILTGLWDPAPGWLSLIDTSVPAVTRLRIRQRPECAVCGRRGRARDDDGRCPGAKRGGTDGTPTPQRRRTARLAGSGHTQGDSR